MRKLAISFTMLLLGSIFILILVNPILNNNPYDSSGTQLQTKDNDVQPVLPPKPSRLIHYKPVYNISQSADDAWTDSSAVPRTFPSAATLVLGGHNSVANGNNRKVCLRWNISIPDSIPENVSIYKAYLNLTVESIANWNGFKSEIWAFDSANTSDFSDANEDIRVTRPRSWPPVNWIWPNNNTGLIQADKTYTSPDISSLLQRVIERSDWKNNSIFGLYMRATGAGGQAVQLFEYLNFHSFDGGNPDYAPKLIVEWEYTPAFTSIPANLTVNNNTLGYHLGWTAVDDNPTNYTIFGNETIGESTKQVQNGTWESLVEIRYDMPRIDIQNYPFVIVKYNITIYDDDGKFDSNVVDITVTYKGLPTIDVKFVQEQENKEFSYEDQNYFATEKGPFTIRMYNKTPIYPRVSFSAFYPFNRLSIWSSLLLLGFIPTVGNIFTQENSYFDAVCYEDWSYAFQYGTSDPAQFEWRSLDFNYTDAAGCWQLTPTVGAPSGMGALNHTFQLAIYLPILPSLSIYEYYGFPIQHLLYDLTNNIKIDMWSIFGWGGEFIYLNQTVSTVKGGFGMWDELNFAMLNKDTTPPFFGEPIFTDPEEPDLHYEVRILAYTERKVLNGGTIETGAEIDEVYLYYNIDDGAWKKTEMVLQYGNYYGEIPPQDGGAKITYYMEMVDIAGNIIKTDEYEETAVTFVGPSPLVPILGILLAFLGALSLVLIFRYRNKRALKKASAEKLIKKPKKGVIKE